MLKKRGFAVEIIPTEGAPVVRDKNGPISGAVITHNADGSVTIDLPGTVVFDPATLDIHAVDAAGNSTRNGDINGTGKVDIVSALKSLRVAVGLDAAGAAERLRADVAPLVNGVPTPDGVIDIFDVGEIDDGTGRYLYGDVDEKKAEAIFRGHVLGGRPVEVNYNFKITLRLPD